MKTQTTKKQKLISAGFSVLGASLFLFVVFSAFPVFAAQDDAPSYLLQPAAKSKAVVYGMDEPVTIENIVIVGTKKNKGVLNVKGYLRNSNKNKPLVVKDNLRINGDLRVKDDLQVNDNLTVDGDLSVTGSMNISADDISDASLSEVKLDVNNDPVDGYYLKWNNTANKMEWAAVSASSLSTPVSVAEGGTGAATASDARTNLGLAIGTNVQAYDSDLTAYAGITPTTAGLALLDDANAAAQLTTLGAQASDADLTTYAGITPSANIQTLLGSADFAAARTNLSLVPGTNVQAYDAELAALAGLTSAANKLPYFTGSGTATVADITSAGLALLDDANAAAQLTTLGAQASDADLTTYAGITPSANIQTLLGSADFAAARTNLSLVIGTNVQAWDTDLDTWAGKTPPTGVVVGTTDSQTLSGKSLTSPSIGTSPTAAGATWTDLGTVTTADINGGTIDGTTIGATSATTGRFTSVNANGLVTLGTQTVTIADNGGGTPADGTITPTKSYIEISCNDANGCGVTMDETGMIGGYIIKMVSLTSNTVNFSDTSGVSELAGVYAATQYDTLTLIYTSDRWIEYARSVN